MIPDFQTVMLPVLQILSDGKEYSLRNLIQIISDQFNLTEEERAELLPSEVARTIDNRVGWATTYLRKAKIIDSPRRGISTINDEGRKILNSKPSRIDIKFLKGLPGFLEWRTTSKGDGLEQAVTDNDIIETGKTPEELLNSSYSRLREELAVELLDKVKNSTPSFFEYLVVDLLIKMGYGGSRKEAGQVMGKSGDGGIDGIIKEDKLGLDTIYIQAKKYSDTVPISHVRDFAGSLLSKKARKGIFLTTSNYPMSAHDFVGSIDPRIILIDGIQLAELMIEHNVGVSTKKVYDVKRLDTDYFDEV